MSNQRFYIVRICVPDFLIFIPPFLKKELLLHSDCPQKHLPVFLVIDRENEQKNIVCFMHEYAIDKEKNLNKKHPNLKTYSSPKISSCLHFKKDIINKKITIGLITNGEDEKLCDNIETKNLLDTCLESFFHHIIIETPEYANDITAREYISNTIEALKEQKRIESAVTEKNELTHYLPTLDELENSEKKNLNTSNIFKQGLTLRSSASMSSLAFLLYD